MKISDAWITQPETQAVCRVLTDAGYQAYFVGGCVRNALLRTPVSDLDIATDAIPQKVIDLSREAGLKAIPTGLDHGTITVVSGHIPHEITTFRHDVETDGRRAVVAFSAHMIDDAKRRDFTMNALYADPKGEILDPLGMGIDDLSNRRVRFIEDPDLRIREDYLRILRFFRFHAWYGDPFGGPDPEALAAIAANLDGIGSLSRERIGAEMRKLLAAPEPAHSVASMRMTGTLARVLEGGDDRALGLLISIEQHFHLAPDSMRRLACLGGDGHGLRLSNDEKRRLAVLRDGIGSGEAAGVLGYRHGAEMAVSILALRAAMLEQHLAESDVAAANSAADQKFPVKADDLMPDLQGPALGARLKQLETKWIASGFTLTKAQLLA
ncbi:CCA-adding enzyme [Thalassovita gelatinovora]|uniref:CCA-adding enzyme n=1 Tax=Thalassovita gelatinovora TaxID=53501 RepID=A0A0P1FA11_THAGE|nr:CCA tRNA nucleotidyltransferase [Thalassovita gelatinovora]QIZ81077.1 CCA tRNA nucleotidyltransferase [Thalassovita gelatinovora]CUH64942.1 CCA-adding enzyme [Thalassovita gelatinovora]SEP89136.1 poly(A) polymerase [Thalassovita gelatinovora]